MSTEFPVLVVATPQFLGKHEEKFTFAYTIQIKNCGDKTITLQNRQLISKDCGPGQEWNRNYWP